MKKGVDCIGITVCFYCHDGKGNLLLQKRSQKARDEQGRWDCGGGSMSVGESFEQTVRRELKEEYSVSPKKIQFAGVHNVLRKNRKEKTHWISLIFVVLVDPRKVKNGDPEKIEKIGWSKMNKLPRPLHSHYLKHLEIARKAIKFLTKN